MGASPESNPADAAVLLTALQHADSFFPAGGIAFSWGLETLRSDGLLPGAEEVAQFVETQLAQRWAVSDRAALVAAYRAAGDLAQLCTIDQNLEVITLAVEMRDGSRRGGSSLLSVHERLGTPGVTEFRAAIRAGRAHGHLPVVQGFVWHNIGLTEAACEAVAAHTFCVGLVGAALRMGVMGHLHGQQILTRVRPLVAQLLAVPAPAMDCIYTCAFSAEIAVMRHEVQGSRLFAN
jgi:urease accessory protein